MTNPMLEAMRTAKVEFPLSSETLNRGKANAMLDHMLANITDAQVEAMVEAYCNENPRRPPTEFPSGKITSDDADNIRNVFYMVARALITTCKEELGASK